MRWSHGEAPRFFSFTKSRAAYQSSVESIARIRAFTSQEQG